MKEIILDTETTGLSVKEGHRIVEIGCMELENFIPTNNNFHCYLNPQRKVSKKALENKLKDNISANNDLMKEILNLNEKEQNIRINQMVEQLADRLKKDKNDLEGWIMLYQSYKVLGKNEKALKAIRDAIKLNPQNINLKQILLRELLPTNKKPVFSKETNKLVNDILVLEPNNVDGLFFSGFAAYNKGEKKKAITYWDLLLKQLPKDSLMSKEINKRIKLLQD